MRLRACRESSAAPLHLNEKANAEELRPVDVDMMFTSCLAVGPYASIHHPQDVLSLHNDDADVALLHPQVSSLLHPQGGQKGAEQNKKDQSE